MINKITNTFNIQDLELLSGIKAHTIRIWEKRYKLFNPDRIGRNVRVYNHEDVQKILNISLLYHQGFKISKLAQMSSDQIAAKTKDIESNNSSQGYIMNSLLMAMYSFDETLFENIYEDQINVLSFPELFEQIFVPLLHRIGLLWQTNGITPANEHFISNLIYQKIILQTSLLDKEDFEGEETYVLFLPEGELHEIGLLYLNYILKSQKKKTIYLGRDLPLSNIKQEYFKQDGFVFLCTFTIERSDIEKMEFLDEINSLLSKTNNKCHVLGRMWMNNSSLGNSNQITFYKDYKSYVSFIEGYRKIV